MPAKMIFVAYQKLKGRIVNRLIDEQIDAKSTQGQKHSESIQSNGIHPKSFLLKVLHRKSHAQD